MGDHAILRKIASWAGLIASILVFIVGLARIALSKSTIYWPEYFFDDINQVNWRWPLFSFQPDVFVDAWTPIVFGLVGIFCHYEQFDLRLITRNYIRFFIFHLISGLFACIGYCGGFGIVCSTVTWFTCLISLIVAILGGEDDASLRLTMTRCRK